MIKLSYLLFLLLMFTSCGTDYSDNHENSSQSISSDLYSSIEIKNSSLDIGWGEEISQSVFDNFSDPDLLPLQSIIIDTGDLSALGCENFNSLEIDQKKIFFIVFLGAVTELESDFNTNDETYDKYHKNTNIGFLQIDRHSAGRHAPNIASNFSDDDLKDPKVNLHVGVYILKNQISGKWRDDVRGRLFPEKTYYWEVLNQKHRSKFISSFKNNLDLLPFCEE